MGLNKKGNVILQSETVDKTWGYGRTTYQEFNAYEIPYITLYETAKYTQKYEYTISKENVKRLIDDVSNKEQYQVHRKAMLIELKKAMKEMEKNKAKYYAFKEFNGWSQALGWLKFKENYDKYSLYDFKEYIEEKEFSTPTSWIKKLANNGNEQAIREMLRRAELVSKGTLSEEIAKAEIRVQRNNLKEKLDHIKSKELIIM